jgi:hypothetical protein
MGLDCSHGAFSGAYSAFNRLRQEVAWVIGGSFPPHYLRNLDGSLALDKHGNAQRDTERDEQFFYIDSETYGRADNPGLWEFLCHSDCDGEISPEMCAKVADELEALLPKVRIGEGGGHILRGGGYRAVLQRFIDGCRDAHRRNEPLTFS